MTPARIMRIAHPERGEHDRQHRQGQCAGRGERTRARCDEEMGGSTPSHVAKTRIAAEPITKSGSAMKPSVTWRDRVIG